ncbi:MAG: hypothetical protein IPJ71_10515 [Bdellovibrionales bacterium]|nr:hypothetical protein [Bdellovibrionales bacterium]
MDRIDFDHAKRELSILLKENEEASMLFRLLHTRKRSTPITDLPQTLVYLRKMNPKGVDTTRLKLVLSTMEKLNFCSLKGDDGREKIHWNVWIFPIYINEHLVGIDTLSMHLLQSNKNAFGHFQKRIKEKEKDYFWPPSKRKYKLDIDFEVNVGDWDDVSPLAEYTLDQLLAEIKRRGLSLQLQVKN